MKLKHDKVSISFDEETLNNNHFNVRSYKNDVKDITNKDKKKQLFLTHKKEQEERRLRDKLENRYLSVDLNPEFIGISILDKTKGSFTIIHKRSYDLTKLNEKLNLESTDLKQIQQNNKRKYEVGKLWKTIFKLAKTYKVGYFVMEDLNFKQPIVNDFSKEFNRKVKNIWNLNYQLNLINKHCNESGIIKIEVNPIYSSFIGNIEYKAFDPVSSSIEIGRRGIYKYTKGFKLIPEITKDNLNTMITCFFKTGGDVSELDNCKSWKEYYLKFKESRCKYRFDLKSQKDFKYFRMNSIKSKVFSYTFI